MLLRLTAVDTRPHVIGFVADFFFFPLWRADFKIFGFAVEFAGCVGTVALSGKQKLRIQKYPDRCGPGLINLKRNGKENVTSIPAIEEDLLEQLKASGVFFEFFPTLNVKNLILALSLPTTP